MDTVLITVDGPDRTGLVERLSAAIEGAGGNWQESRLARLGGQFAGVVRASLPAAARADLAAALERLAGDGLRARLVLDREAGDDGGEGRRCALRIVANDRPGIVHDVARALALHGANVEELDSEVVEAPMASGPLFQCQLTVSTASGEALERAIGALESLAADLMVETLEID